MMQPVHYVRWKGRECEMKFIQWLQAQIWSRRPISCSGLRFMCVFRSSPVLGGMRARCPVLPHSSAYSKQKNEEESGEIQWEKFLSAGAAMTLSHFPTGNSWVHYRLFLIKERVLWVLPLKKSTPRSLKTFEIDASVQNLQMMQWGSIRVLLRTFTSQF